jgi:hypothetical protein
MTRSTDIAANGAIAQEVLGAFNFLYVLTATASFQISFDGNTWVDSGGNKKYDRTGKGSERVYFRAKNGVAATVTFDYDLSPISFQDTAQSNRATAALGNFGIATGAAAAGGKPACDANGYLQITNAMNLAVAGTNASGQRRQVIIFSLATASPAPLNVLDPNGFAFMTIAAGQTISLVTDSAFILSGAGGTAWATVGQIFLAN